MMPSSVSKNSWLSLEDGRKGKCVCTEGSRLKENFNRDFWLESEDYFATALDKNKKPVDSITSNPGHCLMTGIVDEDRAEALVNRLFSDELYTGMGDKNALQQNEAVQSILLPQRKCLAARQLTGLCLA